MTGWEMAFFVLSVVTPVGLIVGVSWYRLGKRDAERLKDGFRHGPHVGGPNHWNRPR
jgi:hypothetical protein